MIIQDNRSNFTNNFVKEKFSTINYINKKRFSYNNYINNGKKQEHKSSIN